MSELYALRISSFTEEIERRVPALADEVERYDRIPVVIARTDERRTREIAAVPGVLGVCACTEGQRRIVWSIDRLLRVVSAHRETVLMNGVANAYPGAHTQPPPYPRLRLSPPPPRIEFDPTLQLPTRACVVAALNLQYRGASTASLRRWRPCEPSDPCRSVGHPMCDCRREPCATRSRSTDNLRLA